jgi:two-component system, LytTR family, sensor kinase
MEKKTVIKFHIIFWVVVLTISLFQAFIYIENTLFVSLLTNACLTTIFNGFTFYIIYFAVSQKIFNKRRVIFLLFLGIIYLMFSSFVFALISYYPFMYFYPEPIPAEYTLSNWIKGSIYDLIAYNTIFLILGCLSKVTLIWYRNQIRQKETEKQNITNELAMLRAQINPHFLFNTLNNIKSLIKSLPSKAVFSIDKLTGIMQYMLYESSFDKVSLTNEINHINNYIDLEKIRYSDPNFIDFKISGDYSEIQIPPLIFMPFIENAFKHGNKLKPAPGIIIRIDVAETNLHFEITNFIKENYEMQNKNSGFGLVNIKRRLDLLFDNKYELKIVNKNKTFAVNLNLTIS